MNFINPEKLVGEQFKDKVPKSYIFKLFNINNEEVYRIYENISKPDSEFIFESKNFEEIVNYINNLK